MTIYVYRIYYVYHICDQPENSQKNDPRCRKWPKMAPLKSSKMTVFQLFWARKCKYLVENDYSRYNFNRFNELHRLFANLGQKMSNFGPKMVKKGQNWQKSWRTHNRQSQHQESPYCEEKTLDPSYYRKS